MNRHSDVISYIDVVFLVAKEEVVHDGGFMQLCKCGHVFHSMDAAGVHGVNRLSAQLRPLLVDHLETWDISKKLASTA